MYTAIVSFRVSKVDPPSCNIRYNRVKKIKSNRILKINNYTDARYLALYDFVLHFVASANLGLCESYELLFLVSLGHRHRATHR